VREEAGQRAEETNPGLFTIRANCSRTAVAGTTSGAVLADISADIDGGGLLPPGMRSYYALRSPVRVAAGGQLEVF
jgi:hypothetical protein